MTTTTIRWRAAAAAAGKGGVNLLGRVGRADAHFLAAIAFVVHLCSAAALTHAQEVPGTSAAASRITMEGGRMCPGDGAVVDNPFAGVTINVLGRSFGHNYFMEKVSEWENITGARVNVPVAAKSGGELNRLTWEDMSTGANFYDGYIATNQNVPSLAVNVDADSGEPWIMNLDGLVKDSETLDWPGIHGTFRENICLYDSHIYTLPFDGDQYFLYYRRDLQERDGWEVPKTWDELVDLAEMYDGQDLNGDGVPDYAMCQPNQEGMNSVAMYSIMAPLLGLLQTHPESHADVKSRIYPKRSGAYFGLDEDGLRPLVDNAAVRRVLPLMRRIYELGQREEINLCCGTKDEGSDFHSGHGLFRTGRCAFYYSFPSVGTNTVRKTQRGNETVFEYQHGRTGTAELPGWTEYLDRETDTLRPCTVEECPASVPLDEVGGGSEGAGEGKGETERRLNRASFFANGGMGGVINGRVSELRRLAVFNLFSYFSKTLETTRAGMPYNPFRDPKHFRLEDYVEAGWDETDARLYLDAARTSLDNQNVGTDLRVPYAVEGLGGERGFVRAYAHRFFEYFKAMEGGDVDPDEAAEETILALDRDIAEWIKVHDVRVASSDTYWTGEIEQIYRRSMNLPLRPAPVNETYHSIQNIRWFGWGLGAIVILSSFLFLGWVYLKRETRVVRASQPPFLAMICVGASVMGASLFPLGIDDTMTSKEGCDIACVAWPWFLACGFTISFAALVSKQLRINKLFHNPRFKRIKVSVKDVMVPFATLFGLNFVLLLSWTLVDPPTWQIVQVDALNSYGRCATSEGKASKVLLALIAVVNITALIMTNIQAYRARSISDEFAESKYIGIANLVVLELVVFSFPVAFLVSSNPSAKYFVFSSIIFVISMSLLLLMFVPKILLVHRAGDDRKKSKANESSMSSVAESIKRMSMQSEGSNASGHWRESLRASTGVQGIRVTRVVDEKELKHVTKKAEREQHEHEEQLMALKAELTEMGVDAEGLFERVGIDLSPHASCPVEGGVTAPKRVSWEGESKKHLLTEPVTDATLPVGSAAPRGSESDSNCGDESASTIGGSASPDEGGTPEPSPNDKISTSSSNKDGGVKDVFEDEGYDAPNV